MTKEVMEKALSLVDDSYMAEALEYEKHMNNKVRSFSRLGQMAAALVIILFLGGFSAFAYGKTIKEVKVEDGKAFVGDPSLVEESVGEEEAIVYDPNYEAPVITMGDETTAWLERRVEKIKRTAGYNPSDKKTTYIYESYEKASMDLNMELWFENLPGEALEIQGKDNLQSGTFHIYSIMASYQLNKGKYYFYQVGFSDNMTMHPDMYFSDFVENVENERTYKNENGVIFTLVDGTVSDVLNEFDLKEGTVITSAIIADDSNIGFIQFEGMKEKDIYKVLDCFAR